MINQEGIIELKTYLCLSYLTKQVVEDAKLNMRIVVVNGLK